MLKNYVIFFFTFSFYMLLNFYAFRRAGNLLAKLVTYLITYFFVFLIDFLSIF